MKHFKKLPYVLLFASCAAVAARANLVKGDQHTLTQVLLCQNAPTNPNNAQLNSYITEMTKIIKRNSGTPKTEMIDYSPHTIYQLKKPLTINGIKFSKITTIDWEDGYSVFRATGRLPSNNQSTVINKFPKKGDTKKGYFDLDTEGKNIEISCTQGDGV